MFETILFFCLAYAAPEPGDFPRAEWESACVEAATFHHGSQAPIHRPSGEMGSGDVEQWRDLVAVFFPAEAVDRMLCLMRYESGGNQHADNPESSAAGLFQLIDFWYRDTYGMDPYDPVANIQMARWVWDQQGYAAWNPYTRGLCTGHSPKN